MEARKLIEIMTVAERLKDTTRHCFTARGMKESVAAHSWMMTLMALFLKEEFPDADMDKVIKMCIIHDLGECFTGDVPSFYKTKDNEALEKDLLNKWVESLPAPFHTEFKALYAEMRALETVEAKIYKAIDNMEAVFQHNVSDISTWLPLEYELNLTYGEDKVQFSEYMKELREELRKDTLRKISMEKFES